MADPVTVSLFWGDQPFLLREAALEVLDREHVRATEVDAREWRGGETTDLATPSLWGHRRALLVTNCQALPEGGIRELRSYLSAPSPDALLVLTVVSRAARTPPALVKAVQEARGVARQVVLRRQDLPKWLVDRAAAGGARLTGPAAATMIATLGDDPATLAQAVEQLISAFPGTPLGPEHVRAQFRGLGEQRVWDLCDQALTGRLPEALVTLRSLLEAREDPLLVLGGIASRIRDLIRVQAVPERLAPAEAATAAGLRFDWQVRRYREQARRFGPGRLATLHRQVVETDRALKGGVAGDVVLSMLVAAMAGHHDVGLDQPVRVSR
jgi:DNA polymerase-3 subunit delta